MTETRRITYFPLEEETVVDKAEGVVAEYLYDQTNGRPGFFTAFSAALICRCKRCVEEFNSYLDFQKDSIPQMEEEHTWQPRRPRGRRGRRREYE